MSGVPNMFGRAGNAGLRDPQVAQWGTAKQREEWNYCWLSLAKVIARNPAQGTVDLIMGHGGVWHNVRVMGGFSGDSGHQYIPHFAPTVPFLTKDGTVDLPVPGQRDLWAVVGYLDGNSKSGVVLGFLNPLSSQLYTKTPGLEVGLHESGTYRLTTPTGKTQVTWPDGTSLVVGEDTTPHDMASENSQWNPPTNATPIQFQFKHSSGFTITFNGTTLEIGAGTQHPLTFADALVTAFNAHTHNVTTSSGTYTTGAPTTAIVESDVASTALTSS